ncbi:MAG: carbon-nitrogen hydrolase family protein [Aigarchaeota archaeon]|nr:carbon-nitrogen hydrolase family protein [Aigarchaeota archaeon]MDW8092113.1 carbon-nitrogen hydrolase family protein [Nitrososphaerota archaeon]
MRVALLQTSPTPKKADNLHRILDLLNDMPPGTDLAVLPEFCMGTPERGPDKRYVEDNAEGMDGEFVSSLRSAARERSTWIVANFYERARDGGFYDTNVAVDRSGNIVSTYRKIHLFDAFGYRESSVFRPGQDISVFDLGEFKVGLAICFDVRFPELFRRMALMGANLFVISSAWYGGPNKEWQWRLMCAARSSENVAYLVAVDNAAAPFIGKSLVADPYGSIILELGEREGVAVLELSADEVRRARERLPLLELRRVKF